MLTHSNPVRYLAFYTILCKDGISSVAMTSNKEETREEITTNCNTKARIIGDFLLHLEKKIEWPIKNTIICPETGMDS